MPLIVAPLHRWRTELAQNTGMSPNTINRMISAVKKLMREAANQGYIDHETALSFESVQGVKISALKERTKTTARTKITPAADESISPSHLEPIRW